MSQLLLFSLFAFFLMKAIAYLFSAPAPPEKKYKSPCKGCGIDLSSEEQCLHCDMVDFRHWHAEVKPK